MVEVECLQKEGTYGMGFTLFKRRTEGPCNAYEGVLQKGGEYILNELADKPLPPNATRSELRSRVPWDLISKAHDAGLRQLSVPEEYGGGGYGVLENALVIEAFCCQDSWLGIALSVADSSSEIILRYGNEEQKGRYLSVTTKGEAISSGVFTEPDHGIETPFK